MLPTWMIEEIERERQEREQADRARERPAFQVELPRLPGDSPAPSPSPSDEGALRSTVIVIEY